MPEHFLLVCKRKATRAVHARHPTAASQTCTQRLFFPRSVHAPASLRHMRACADGFAVRPLAVLIKSCICAAAYKKLFFNISNSDVYKRIKNVILRKAVTKNLQNLYFTKDSSLRSEWQNFILCGFGGRFVNRPYGIDIFSACEGSLRYRLTPSPNI